MMNPQKELNEFTAFAESKFITHQEELEISYKDPNLHPRDQRKAFLNHQQILEMELIDKIDEMLTKDTAYLGPSLISIKDVYINRLQQQITQRN